MKRVLQVTAESLGRRVYVTVTADGDRIGTRSYAAMLGPDSSIESFIVSATRTWLAENIANDTRDI